MWDATPQSLFVSAPSFVLVFGAELFVPVAATVTELLPVEATVALLGGERRSPPWCCAQPGHASARWPGPPHDSSLLLSRSPFLGAKPAPRSTASVSFQIHSLQTWNYSASWPQDWSRGQVVSRPLSLLWFHHGIFIFLPDTFQLQVSPALRPFPLMKDLHQYLCSLRERNPESFPLYGKRWCGIRICLAAKALMEAVGTLSSEWPCQAPSPELHSASSYQSFELCLWASVLCRSLRRASVSKMCPQVIASSLSSILTYPDLGGNLRIGRARFGIPFFPKPDVQAFLWLSIPSSLYILHINSKYFILLLPLPRKS